MNDLDLCLEVVSRSS